MDSRQGSTFICPACAAEVDEACGVEVATEDGEGTVTICGACALDWPPEPIYKFFWL